jgi:hypothetical protein
LFFENSCNLILREESFHYRSEQKTAHSEQFSNEVGVGNLISPLEWWFYIVDFE